MVAEEKMMMLRRWAVGPSVNNSFPEHLWKYLSDFDLLLVQNYDLFRRFDAHFVSGADCEKILGRWQSYCTYMFSKVPSSAFSGFWTLTLKLSQHFDLIYNIGKSDWKILRNIMKTAQDSYTITIKQIVRFQERMHLEKFQVDKIKNGRLSAIIHLDRPDIAEYHENCSR